MDSPLVFIRLIFTRCKRARQAARVAVRARKMERNTMTKWNQGDLQNRRTFLLEMAAASGDSMTIARLNYQYLVKILL